MQGKNTIVFYKDWKVIFDELSNEQAGELIKHFFSYINDENPLTDNPIIRLAFAPIQATLKRDLKKWNDKCLKNSEIAKMRWDKKNANGCERIKHDAKHADSDSDSDSDNDSDSDKEIIVNNYIKDKELLPIDKFEKIMNLELEVKTRLDAGFTIFWDQYHEITGKDKTDKASAFKHWQKLTLSEQRKAILSIKSYFNSVRDKKYVKKCRTYLADQNFNDEFNVFKSTSKPKLSL